MPGLHRFSVSCSKLRQGPKNHPARREMDMNRIGILVAAALVAGLGLTPAQAQDKIKIGIITTLTGPPAVLGQQLRNGFQLAVKTLGGKLGGREAELIV